MTTFDIQLLPLLFEDEGYENIGESLGHTTTEYILHIALIAHLVSRPEYRVLSNMNLYYHPNVANAYVSPDIMVVVPPQPLNKNLGSYRIGSDGPAPVLAVEVLSSRTFQQGDLTVKPDLYARLGVEEYWLIDTTGRFLAERICRKTLTAEGRWIDEYDAGAGVVSDLFGFRIIIDSDEELRVIDERTQRRYPRPDEIAVLSDRIAELERELQQLRLSNKSTAPDGAGG